MPGYEVIGSEEFAELRDLFDRSGVLFRHGFEDRRNGVYKVKEFEDAFAERLGVSHALAVTSGTAALRVALAGLDIGPGDEVITQSFTFVATVEAVVECGGTPVICEIDETLNMDPGDLAGRLTDRTRAIIAVHMLGTPARLPEITRVAKDANVALIEDTAWGCGGKLAGRNLGTWGDVATFSFDFAKVITTGEGGMVVCANSELHGRMAAYHDHGHENNPSVPRWEDTRSGSGFNYRMTELQGAVGLAQLRKLDGIIARQRENAERLRKALEHLDGIEWRGAPEESYETADAVVFFTDGNATARAIRASLLKEGVGTKILPEAITWHFAATWEHIPALVKRAGGSLKGAWPRSEELLSRAVALPVSVKMDPSMPERVRRAVERVVA